MYRMTEIVLEEFGSMLLVFMTITYNSEDMKVIVSYTGKQF